MKIINLSDLHLTATNFICRKDDVTKTQLNKLEYILNFAKELGPDTIILQGGDFFDTPRNWFLLSDIAKLVTKYNVRIFTVHGQHTLYFRSNEKSCATNLGILDLTNNLKILSKNKQTIMTGINFVHLYGCNWGEPVPKPDTSKKGINILVIHAPISMNKIYEKQSDFIYAKTFLKKHKYYDLILCGDIHQRFEYTINDRHILNTGCILRKTADKYNYTYKPGFFIYDTCTKKYTWQEIPHEKAQKVLTKKHIENKQQTQEILDTFIESINTKQKTTINVKQNLENICKKNKLNKELKKIISLIIEEVDCD